VDISHESLIRQWKQLDKWLNDESDWRDIYVRLADDAERYKKGRVDLWRDPQLQIALNWYADRKPNKAWAERYHPGFDAAIEFMEKSRAEREAEAEREEARRKKELADALEREETRRKQLRRNKIFSIFLSLSLLSSLMAGGYALKLKAQTDLANDNLKKSNTALDEARKDEEEKNVRLEVYVKRNSELVTNLESQKRDLEAAKFSVTKALNAAERSAANATLSAFVANEQATEARKQSRISSQHLAQLLGLHSVHLAPEGANDGEALEKRALLAAQALRIKTDNGESLPTVEGDRAAREILALAPRIVSTRRISEYGNGASFSQGAGAMAALTSNKDARLIDPFTGAIKPGLEKLPAGAEQISISPDGKYLAMSQTASEALDTANKSAGVSQVSGAARSAIRIQIFETASGRPFGKPIVPSGSTSGGASTLKMLFSPDSSRLVTLTNTEAQLWETASGKAVGKQSPDPVGETTQEPRQPNQAQRAPNQMSRSLLQKSSVYSSSRVVDAAFSPDGKTLATIHTTDPPYSRALEQTGGASRLYFWNTETGARAAAPIEADVERRSFFSAVTYRPDGKYLLTIRRGLSSPTFIELWNSQTGKLAAEPLDNIHCKWAVFNKSGDEVAVVTDANTVVKLTVIDDGARVKLESGKPIYYGSEPHAVAFSDDGAQLIVVGNEGEITISETKAAAVVENIPAAENAVMTFTPNGRLHATEDGRKVKTWDSLTGKSSEFPLFDSDNPIKPLALAFSNGGRFLATVSDVIRIWDGAKSERIDRSIKTPDRIKLAAFSPTGDFLAMAGDNGAAVGEEMSDAASRLRLPDVSAATNAIAVSEDARREERSVRYLATTDGGGEARIRELIKDKNGVYKAGAVARVNPGAEITSMIFLEREQLLATASGSVVKIWDAKNGNQIGELNHSSRVNDLSVHLGRPFLAVACQDGKIVVWEMKRDHSWSQEQTLEFTEPVEKVAFSLTGPHLAAAGAGKAQVWRLAGWRKYGVEINAGKAAAIAAHGSGGSYLWVVGEDGMCRIRRFETGQIVGSPFKCAGAGDKVSFSPDGRTLVTGSVSFPRVWNMISRSLADGWIPAVAVSPDGKYLASSYGRAVRVHSATDLRELHSRVIEGEITLLAFNHTGDLMIVSRKKNALVATDESEDVWNIETRNAGTGDLIGKTPGLKEGISAVAFSPTEDVFATASSDLNGKPGIVLWKNTAPEIKRAEGKPIHHGHSFKELAFSPDGKFLAATGPEGAHIFEVATRQEVAEIPEARNSPAFSPDGKYLAVTSENGIEVLHWRPDDLAEDVCARLK
ncbi:MAG: WD40 repeat domain-containing protein, partial [Blastocatellia bacterium]